MSIDDSKLKKIYLEDIIQGITLSIVNSKLLIDKRVNEVRKDYERDEFMRALPINVFEISEVDVELRFVIDEVEKNDNNIKVIIDTNIEKFATVSQPSLSTIKFKIAGKPLIEYQVDKTRVFK